MNFDQLTLSQAVAELRAGTVTSTALTTEALARARTAPTDEKLSAGISPSGPYIAPSVAP